MNKNVLLAKRKYEKNKRTFKILLIAMLTSILVGALFFFIISSKDKVVVINSIKNFFMEVKKDNNLNYTSSLINSLITNILYVLIIWLLGISIIGLPIIILLMFYKAFILGFSISSVINLYGFKGILGVITYTFPHQFIMLIIIMLLGFYSINFSIKLFKYLFLHKVINFKDIMRKYIKILIISLIGVIILSLFETFISTYLIKLFTYLIK